MINRPSLADRIACHEASHAVAAWLLHYPISEVRVFVNKYGHYGRMAYDEITSGRTVSQRIEESALILCAGNAGESLFTGRKYWSHFTADYINAANELSWLYGCKDEIAACISFLWLRARNLLAEPENWFAVTCLAEDIEAVQQEPGYWDDNGEYYINYDCEDTHQMHGYEVQYVIGKAIERYKQLHQQGVGGDTGFMTRSPYHRKKLGK